MRVRIPNRVLSVAAGRRPGEKPNLVSKQNQLNNFRLSEKRKPKLATGLMFSFRFLATEESSQALDLFEVGDKIGAPTVVPELTENLSPVEFPQQKLELLNRFC